MRSRTLWLNPVFGIAGDMLLGALIDVGAGEHEVREVLASLGVGGWDLGVESVSRHGLVSKRASVSAEPAAHRSWSEIDAMLAEAHIPGAVSAGARSTFGALARAEAARHGVGVDDVQFHEVGAVDAIVDIVGCWAALASLDIRRVASGSIGLGAGAAESSHGLIPHPAPAVLALLGDLPVVPVDTELETATPTGVALLRTMVNEWGPIPAGRILDSGFGAGARDLESHSNVLTAVLLEAEDAAEVNAVMLQTTVDDIAPEVIAYVMERALAIGADDAWAVPAMMKKGRPGHEIRILCSQGLAADLTELLASETRTLGVRSIGLSKQVFPRTFDSVVVEGHTVAIKSGPYGAKPEFEDLKVVAAATGRPLVDISRDALEAWLSRVEVLGLELESE